MMLFRLILAFVFVMQGSAVLLAQGGNLSEKEAAAPSFNQIIEDRVRDYSAYLLQGSVIGNGARNFLQHKHAIERMHDRVTSGDGHYRSAGIVVLGASKTKCHWLASIFKQSSGAFPIPGLEPHLTWSPSWGENASGNAKPLEVSPEVTVAHFDPLYNTAGVIESQGEYSLVLRDGRIFALQQRANAESNFSLLIHKSNAQFITEDASKITEILFAFSDDQGTHCVVEMQSPAEGVVIAERYLHEQEVPAITKDLRRRLARSFFLGFRRDDKRKYIIFDSIDRRLKVFSHDGELLDAQCRLPGSSIFDLQSSEQIKKAAVKGIGDAFNLLRPPLEPEELSASEMLRAIERGTVQYCFSKDKEWIAHIDLSSGKLFLQPFVPDATQIEVPCKNPVVNYGLALVGNKLLLFTCECERRYGKRAFSYCKYIFDGRSWEELGEWHAAMNAYATDRLALNILDFQVTSIDGKAIMCIVSRNWFHGKQPLIESRLYSSTGSYTIITGDALNR